jgi:3-hydroxyacyl-CoA dehydrogenase
MSNLSINHINTIAVLGSDVMGAKIAALFASAQYEVLLYDLPSQEGDDPDALVKNHILKLTKMNPLPLLRLGDIKSIHPVNFRDHLEQLHYCDLIIEAISEDINIKQSLYQQLSVYLTDRIVFVSNTSGLSIASLASFLPPAIVSRFCGAHFFNPPRYMKLVELIAHAETDAHVLDVLETLFVRQLGKCVVRAKDTPNFIANRVGVFSLIACCYHTQRLGMNFAQVDALTGPLIGRAKSATFRTLDVVGLDTYANVVATMANHLVDDPWHAYYVIPDWMQTLLDAHYLGQKTGQGCYVKQADKILAWSQETAGYIAIDYQLPEEIKQIFQLASLREQFMALMASPLVEAQFLRFYFLDVWLYCSYCLADIANDVQDVDCAMRHGFAWQYGPFELWQLIGLSEVKQYIGDALVAQQLMVDMTLPLWLQKAQFQGFYTEQGAYSSQTHSYLGRSTLAVYQRQLLPEMRWFSQGYFGETIFETDDVRCWHDHDDIAILTFKSPQNTIGQGVITGLMHAVQQAENHYQGLLIYNHGAHFSYGANLKEFGQLIEAGSAIEQLVTYFQQGLMRVKYARVPVVAVVKGLVLGGACELILHCAGVVAAMESYIGLVETAVGLLPGGGGCKEFALRIAQAETDLARNKRLSEYFKMIALAEMSNNAVDAVDKGLLRASDTLIFNDSEILYLAKEKIKALTAANYRPPLANKIAVMGRAGYANLISFIINMRQGSFISEHDELVVSQLANVLCGGQLDQGVAVTEQWLLKQECQAFAFLATQAKTLQRIQHTLSTGKPLHN